MYNNQYFLEKQMILIYFSENVMAFTKDFFVMYQFCSLWT